jgi:signal transduction histidine kinase
MGQTEIKIFIILIGIIVLIFIIGIIIFIFQLRGRKLLYQKEKIEMERQHKLELLNTQLEIQQATMQHIGREIHDNVGQKLTLASLYSKQLSANTTIPEEKVASISSIIDESLAELRQLSKTLTNPEFANAGLVRLLSEEAKKINSSGICYLSVNAWEGEVGLQQLQKNILFRLLQEFIQNSLKHSGCRNINISIDKQNDQLLVVATDDGKGFDTKNISGGIGLQNIKRRAEQLHALYELKSEAGKGTSLHLQIPSL